MAMETLTYTECRESLYRSRKVGQVAFAPACFVSTLTAACGAASPAAAPGSASRVVASWDLRVQGFVLGFMASGFMVFV